jgi:ribosome-binding protein aMBF1 (putative translation factor)
MSLPDAEAAAPSDRRREVARAFGVALKIARRERGMSQETLGSELTWIALILACWNAGCDSRR